MSHFDRASFTHLTRRSLPTLLTLATLALVAFAGVSMLHHVGFTAIVSHWNPVAVISRWNTQPDVVSHM